MKLIKDNSQYEKESFSFIPTLTSKIADKTLEQLEREGVFVFPDIIKDADDLSRDQMILQSYNSFYRSGNVMGFLGYGKERLTIESRFSKGEKDYLFQYLLDKVLDLPNILDLKADANPEKRFFNILLFLFPYYLKIAMRKGPYKKYTPYSYNDRNIKGSIDVARHIKKNTPFVGNVAYDRREFSYDNDLMELIRHTIEFIRLRPYGNRLLLKSKAEVKQVVDLTPGYELFDRRKIIERNKKKTVGHAYFREYLALQRLCVFILQYQNHQVGYGSQQLYGILFDGSWLWEEYIYNLVSDVFYHPMNRLGKGAQTLFSGNNGKIYPDFISRNSDIRVIADAKYKPVDNIKDKDYLQVLAYMFRFDAKRGYFFYPDIEDTDDKIMWMNRGSTYESNVMSRDDVCTIKHGLKIPDQADSYTAFIAIMRENEKEFVKTFV